MVYTTDALVIRVQNHGENDRLITLLTREGRICVAAKGARSMKSKLSSLTQPYVYGNFEIVRKGSYSYIRSGMSYEMFYGLRDSVEKLFLSAYVCDLAYELTGEEAECGEIMRLTLNTLYAVTRGLRPLPQIKAAFELRAAAISGYMPELSGCEECGRENPENVYFDVMNGALICSECLEKRGRVQAGGSFGDIREASVLTPLTPSALAAVRYVLGAPDEKIFSFALSGGEDMDAFCRAGEDYLLNHLGRGFDSLELYYSVI